VAVHLHSKQVKVQGGVLIDVTDLDLTDVETWAGHTGADIADGRITIYKALDADFTAGKHYGRPTLYTVGEDLTADDWEDTNECGGGLHLSPSTHQALDYNRDATVFLRCTAALADVRPITDGGTAKCKVRTLHVESQVDIMGRDIATTALATEQV